MSDFSDKVYQSAAAEEKAFFSKKKKWRVNFFVPTIVTLPL